MLTSVLRAKILTQDAWQGSNLWFWIFVPFSPWMVIIRMDWMVTIRIPMPWLDWCENLTGGSLKIFPSCDRQHLANNRPIHNLDSNDAWWAILHLDDNFWLQCGKYWLVALEVLDLELMIFLLFATRSTTAYGQQASACVVPKPWPKVSV